MTYIFFNSKFSFERRFFLKIYLLFFVLFWLSIIEMGHAQELRSFDSQTAFPLLFMLDENSSLNSKCYLNDVDSFTVDFYDSNRKRVIPTICYQCDTSCVKGIIIFSHGWGGNRGGRL